MSKENKKPVSVLPIYSFAATWIVFSFIFPSYRLWGLLATAGVSLAAATVVGLIVSHKRKKAGNAEAHVFSKPKVEVQEKPQEEQKYPPEIEAILKEGRTALKEMGRLYSTIQAPDIREKINEIMMITDKITQDAIEDPSDIPQIKKFMNYYLPTTIKLLNTYDRMSAQGIQGENLGKSMQNINEMLDEAIVAFKKRLDSLFANQALDIETDIKVMNTMLAREGLAGEKDFNMQDQKGQTT